MAEAKQKKEKEKKDKKTGAKKLPAGKKEEKKASAEKKIADKKETAKAAEKGKEKEKEKPAEKKEKKKKIFVEMKRIEKPPEVKKMQALARKARKRKPSFKGRFGRESLLRVSKKKWKRWRHPRGIDIKRTQEDGSWPKTGYMASREFKGMHPSGYFEKIVSNKAQLAGTEKKFALKIAAGVGKRKKKELLLEAQKLGLRVLNP